MRKSSVPVLSAFKADGQVADIDAILSAPFEDMAEAVEMIPPMIGWFGHQKGKAGERCINFKYALKEAEAKAYFDLRNGGFVSHGFGEKPTEAALEKAVVLMPEVQKAREAFARAEKDYDWIVATIEALRAKMELLRTCEATRRMEHEPDRNRLTVT